jgi:hypothetical protein
MNKYIVTAPDGSIHKRNTQNHTYNYVVLYMLADKNTWFVEGWRRDLKAAEQVANKLATHPRVDQVIVRETTQVN